MHHSNCEAFLHFFVQDANIFSVTIGFIKEHREQILH